MINQLTGVQLFAIWFLPIVFAVTVHEAAHGYVAKYLGDNTASMLGRLTLNPLRHIDLIGTIIIPTVLLFLGGIIFGWAKPVPINAQNLRHPRRDLAIVSLAGPLSNVFMAFFWAIIAKVGEITLQYNFPGALAINYMGMAGIKMNVIFAILNILPLPPLDGGHVLAWILPKKAAIRLAYIAPFGLFILLFLAAIGFLGAIIGPIAAAGYNLIAMLMGL